MPLAELNHDIIISIALAMSIEELCRLRIVNKDWFLIWIKRQYEREYTIKSCRKLSSACRYHPDAATSLHNVGIELSRDLLQGVQQAETLKTLRSLTNVSNYRVGWNGYGEWVEVAVLWVPIDRSRNTITTLSMTIPPRSVISFANRIGILPHLASFTIFFYTGFVDASSLEEMTAHLAQFINDNSSTLKTLSIGADLSCTHLNLGSLFSKLEKVENLDNITILLPALDKSDMGGDHCISSIRHFLLLHREQLASVAIKCCPQSRKPASVGVGQLCTPQQILDNIHFPMLQQLDVGLVPVEWLAGTMQLHRSLRSLHLSENILSDEEIDAWAREMEILDSDPHPIRNLELCVRELRPSLVLRMVHRFPSVNTLQVAYHKVTSDTEVFQRNPIQVDDTERSRPARVFIDVAIRSARRLPVKVWDSNLLQNLADEGEE